MTSTTPNEAALLDSVLSRHALLNPKQIEHLQKIDFLEFISNNLYKMNTLYAQMQTAYQTKNLPDLREQMHPFLNSCGFIGANALHQVCRYDIYPDLHENRWPQPEAWFVMLGALLKKTCEAFWDELQLRPEPTKNEDE